MAQEEHSQRCSNSSSGGGGGGGGGNSGGGGGGGGGSNRSCKKLKQKKVPQRGLGVAQLEKIRLEEQHKKEVAILCPNPNSSIISPSFANFRSSSSSSSSSIPLPLPSSLPYDSSQLNSVFRPNPNSCSSIPSIPIPTMNVLPPNSAVVPLPNIGLSAISGPGQLNWPKLWSCEYHSEGENSHRLDQSHGFGLRSNLPGESWTAHRIQQPPSLSTMVSPIASMCFVLI